MKKEEIKQALVTLVILTLTIIFFSYNIVICVDSSHYCWLASLLGDKASFNNWDVARGIVFPAIISILTKLFGKNVISLQIGMFIAYSAVLVICYLIYRDIDKEFKLNKFLKIALVILSIFLFVLNPLILGYYHTILTEFVSMTACIMASYMAWKWIELNFTESKIKYILYTIYFAISMAFMWHLKQPYVFTILAPLIISTILSIIKQFNWKNILQRAITIITCVITLFLSLKLWNFTLNNGGVKIEEGRTSSGFLSSQILSGMTEYYVIPEGEQYTIENITNNEKISLENKEKAIEILQGKSKEYEKFLLVECAPYSDLENSKEIKVIYMKGQGISVGEALKFELSMFLEDPKSILKGYFNNYLTTIGLYRAQNIGAGAYVTKELSWSGTYENSYIAYNIYRDMTNNLNVPEHYYRYIENYNGINRQIKVVNIFMNKISLLTIYTFKIFLLAVPILFIISFVKFIILKVKKQQNKKMRIYELLTILYGYSFLNVLMYSVLGALIDRYVISSYLAVNIALWIHFGYICTMIIDKIKNRKNKLIEEAKIEESQAK